MPIFIGGGLHNLYQFGRVCIAYFILGERGSSPISIWREGGSNKFRHMTDTHLFSGITLSVKFNSLSSAQISMRPPLCSHISDTAFIQAVILKDVL